jgi:hypothetical protein
VPIYRTAAPKEKGVSIALSFPVKGTNLFTSVLLQGPFLKCPIRERPKLSRHLSLNKTWLREMELVIC